MKKLFATVFLALLVLVLGLSACADQLETEPQNIEDVETLNFKDPGYDTDETPEDTGAVIRP